MRLCSVMVGLFLCGSVMAQTSAPQTGPGGRPLVGKPAVTKEFYEKNKKPGTYGGRIVFGQWGEPKSFNPITAGESSTTDFTTNMFEGLTDSDPFTGETYGLLAEKYEVAPDGVTWTFHLRPGLKFNDGSPLTADDVVFTWNDLVYDQSRPANVKDPRWPCSTRDATTFDGKPIKVEKVDDLTVRFITPVKVAIMDQMAGVGILSRKKYEPLVKNGSFGGAMGSGSKPEDIVGSGPFMLGSYEPGSKVVLKRNPNYYAKDAAGQQLPYLDELVFVIVKDLNATLIAFEQGVTDIYGLSSGKDVAVLKPKEESGNFSLYQLGPGLGINYLVFNLNEEAVKAGKIPDYKVKWFRDKRFRQAVAYAIDRQALVRNVLKGLGYPLAGPMTASEGPFVNRDLKPYPYDPAKAKALLAEMGFQPGPDGILADPKGHPLAFNINTNSGNTIREEMANFVASDLCKLGMNVKTLFLEFNLLCDKLDSTFDWECLLFALTGGIEPHWGANVYKSDGRLHMWWPNQKQPGYPWEKRIDEIFLAGIQEMDKDKRKALYKEWQEIMWEEQPFIYTVIGERLSALRNRFGNVFPAPIGGVLHNLKEIYVIK